MKTLLWTTIVIFALLGAAWGAAFLLGPQSSQAHDTQQLILVIGSQIWVFARPLLQLVVVLLIVEYFADKAGWKLSPHHLARTWDTRTVVAVFIIATYCIAALSGLDDHYGVKDIVLVVIGFYFGTTRKPGELEPTVTVPASTRPE
jgi:hypothetical protein